MRRDGCQAEQLGGAGDNACDVRAVDPAGRVWVIQCKHRRDGDRGSAVGVGVLQQVNGTARHRTADPRSGRRGRPHQRPLLLRSRPLGRGTPDTPRRPPPARRVGGWLPPPVGPAGPRPPPRRPTVLS
ncbi:restriction endonuclease [Streptomyces sp. NPDC003758]